MEASTTFSFVIFLRFVIWNIKSLYVYVGLIAFFEEITENVWSDVYTMDRAKRSSSISQYANSIQMIWTHYYARNPLVHRKSKYKSRRERFFSNSGYKRI